MRQLVSQSVCYLVLSLQVSRSKSHQVYNTSVLRSQLVTTNHKTVFSIYLFVL